MTKRQRQLVLEWLFAGVLLASFIVLDGDQLLFSRGTTDEAYRDGITHVAPEERGASQDQDADSNHQKVYSRAALG